MIILKKIQRKGEKNRKEWHAYTVYMNSCKQEKWTLKAGDFRSNLLMSLLIVITDAAVVKSKIVTMRF
jgi:hypothetical protein